MNLVVEQQDNYQDVAAIVTSMTDDEKPFLLETVESIFSDPGIGQVILCIEENNDWLDSVIGSLLKDPRLMVVRMPMMPPGAVRNKALGHVQKPWIAYCDGDDVWCKGKTLIQQVYANQTGADFVGAGHYLTDEGGRIRAYGLARFLPMPSTWMVRTEIMKRYPFNETLAHGSDGEWWIRTSNIIEKVKCPRVLVRYRVRSESVSSTTRSKKRKLKLVTVARIPILGLGILFLSYCIWLFTRHRRYSWTAGWSRWLQLYEKREQGNRNS